MSKVWRRGCIPFLLLVAPAFAGGQNTQRGVELFNQCAEIRDDAQRLSCFDSVTREMRGTSQPSGAAATAPTPAATAQQQRADFGLDPEQKRKREAPTRRAQRPQTLDEINAKVAAVKRVGPGFWAILLEDGAIWEVTELNYQFNPPEPGESVRVRKGVLGGFLLHVGRQEPIRVTRRS